MRTMHRGCFSKHTRAWFLRRYQQHQQHQQQDDADGEVPDVHDEIDDAEDGVGSPPAEAAPAVPVVHAPEQKVMSKFLALQLVYGKGPK